ncbi:hypothetical protein LCGC14_2951620 [marine sediment metagenome]|uniref:Uncharacterized protein n=1 Tax=marine sediment metagenome TaxID=412755 RepID=A0A0F8XEU4_9ZZZZ
MLDDTLIKEKVAKIKLLYDQVKGDLPDTFTIVYSNKTRTVTTRLIMDDWDDHAYECLTTVRGAKLRNWILYLNALYEEFSKYNS